LTKRQASRTLHRRAVVQTLLADRGDLLVVSGLGAPTYDCAACGDNPLNFYLWGAMGSAVMVGLGLALAQRERRILVVTGDGEMLMGLGGIATIGVQQPANLSIVVLDNERYGETGGQVTHTAYGVSLAGIASAAGFKTSEVIRTEGELLRMQKLIRQGPGLIFAQIKISPEKLPFVVPPRDGAFLKNRFRRALLGDAATH